MTKISFVCRDIYPCKIPHHIHRCCCCKLGEERTTTYQFLLNNLSLPVPKWTKAFSVIGLSLSIFYTSVNKNSLLEFTLVNPTLWIRQPHSYQKSLLIFLCRDEGHSQIDPRRCLLYQSPEFSPGSISLLRFPTRFSTLTDTVPSRILAHPQMNTSKDQISYFSHNPSECFSRSFLKFRIGACLHPMV